MKQLSQAQARVEFLRWLKAFDLNAYTTLMQESERGLGATDGGGGFWDNISDTFNKVLPTITQSIAQAKIFRAQMKRAKRGLPPLKTAEYAPTMRIQTNIAPETRNAIFAETGSMLKNYALPVVGLMLLGGLWFLVKKPK